MVGCYYCSNTRGRSCFLRASVFKIELLELLCMQDLSVANQFHLCIATVANQFFLPYYSL